MNTQIPKDTTATLSTPQCLWLQSEKAHLAQLDLEVARLQYHQKQQTFWTFLLVVAVIVLSGAILSLILI